jgi:uncharacterized membrane protein
LTQEGPTSNFGQSFVHTILYRFHIFLGSVAEFVTETINNVSHGISVKNAVEKLGLEAYSSFYSSSLISLLIVSVAA